MNKIMQLYIDNKTSPRSFTVTAKDDATRIDLYDVIDDYYGVSATAFVSALNQIKTNDIFLHINSPGGDVFAARAMVAAIAAHPAKITAHIDGLAASAASGIAIACDSVVMQEGSMMMIHKASSIAWGNSEDLIKMADLLDKIDGAIVSDYAKKTGKTDDDLKLMMALETWMTAEEAMFHGFADSITENKKGAKNTWNLTSYKNAPPPDPVNEKPEPIPEPATAGFFMSASNSNRMKLANAL